MNDETLLEELRDIARGVVGSARVPADAHADTALREGGLWLDSLELLRVVIACEARFELIFEPDEDLVGDGLRSFGTLAALIGRRRRLFSRSAATPRRAS